MYLSSVEEMFGQVWLQMVSSEQSDAKFLFQLLPSNVQVARLAHWIIIIYNQTLTRKLINCICPKKKIVFVQIEKNVFVQIEEKNVFVQNSSLDYNHLQTNRKFCSVQRVHSIPQNMPLIAYFLHLIKRCAVSWKSQYIRI